MGFELVGRSEKDLIVPREEHPLAVTGARSLVTRREHIVRDPITITNWNKGEIISNNLPT